MNTNNNNTNQYFTNNSDVVITGIYYYLLTLHEILNALLLLLLRVYGKQKRNLIYEKKVIYNREGFGIVWKILFFVLIKHITDITQ